MQLPDWSGGGCRHLPVIFPILTPLVIITGSLSHARRNTMFANIHMICFEQNEHQHPWIPPCQKLECRPRVQLSYSVNDREGPLLLNSASPSPFNHSPPPIGGRS